MSAFQIGRPRFVTTDEAVAFDAIGIDEYGGGHGLRDAGALDSALAQPRQAFSGEFAHTYPFGMAAAYAFHIAKNHPFVDGNKRAALMCCGAFLRKNGWNLVSEGVLAADEVVRFVVGETDKQGFAAWIEANCRAMPSLELRDFFASLTVETLLSHYQSAAAGGGVGAALQATFTEAERAIPIVGALLAQENMERRLGNHERTGRAVSMALVLTATYRIAEDMGYEW